MEETTVSSNITIVTAFKSYPKFFLLPPPPDADAEGDNIVSKESDLNLPNDERDEEGYSSTLPMFVLIPLASVIVIIALAATIRWKYKIKTEAQTRKNQCSSNNNNDLSIIEEGRKPEHTEETVPFKHRSVSDSSSTSAISRNILVDGSLPVTVNMRIVSDTNKLDDNRSDLYCKINTNTKEKREFNATETKENIQNTVNFDCEVLKEKIPEKQIQNCKEISDNTDGDCQISKDESEPEKTVEIFPKRPKTLQVMTVADNSDIANTNNTRGCLWSEQLWTPDADIIEEDIESPCVENPSELTKEDGDQLFPLMAKGRFKMKPKGLLERRGSNVALTITLKNEEKACMSPPPSSKSPKPLVYLRTATAKMDPLQLHIKSADTARLQHEFWEVPMNHPSEKHFSIPGYGTKNRYRSILPNPHSRVLLPATPSGDPLSAYINANYVRGYSAISESDRRRNSEDGKENDARRMSMKRKAAFIATQGPMANTIVDFWRMVWKENSNAIVMITKLKERKEKCAEYIPMTTGEKKNYEHFEVEVKHVRYADHYTVRTIEIRNNEEEGAARTIYHFWYSEWLDHETPEKLRGLLQLVQEVELKCPDHLGVNTKFGPVIIHCSAGIGRTGCFIAISIGCRQLREEGKVDPLKIICQLRMDRGGMIQTWEQYQYVHVALSRYARLLAGENVSTPLTGGSVKTPDSRSSYKSPHTPEQSSRDSSINGTKTPPKATRIFSPKFYAKPELTPVNESNVSRTPSSENVAKKDANVPEKKEEADRSIFSPHIMKPKSSSRFSFSCADDISTKDSALMSPSPLNGVHDPIQLNGEHLPETGCQNGVGGNENDEKSLTSSKRTKKSVPPRLVLKMNSKPSPVREENWLINGHCNVPEPQNPEDVKNGENVPHITNGQAEKSPAKINGHFDNDENSNPSPQGDAKGKKGVSLGSLPEKSKCNVTPVDKNCQTAAEEEQPKSSFFTFPSPEK